MRVANVQGRIVLVTGEGEGIDVAEASGGRFGPDPSAVYEQWAEFQQWARSERSGSTVTFAIEDLEAPSPTPRQVFAIGLNYADHAAEADLALPSEPAVFTKFVSSFSGPVTEVVLPDGDVDWEVELVAVIGATAKDVPAEEAWAQIAGLCVGQDLSERVLQRIGAVPQFSLAKSYPGFSPMGPYLVTPDELADPDDLELGCNVNGEEVQKGRTSQMVFAMDELIVRLSKVATLYPGDVIFTGTPAGVGAGRKPPRYLGVGDELVSYVEGLGELRQRFVNPSHGA